MTQKVGAVVKAVLRDKDDTAIVLVLKDGNTTSLKDGDNVYVELTNVTTGDKVNFLPAPKVVVIEKKVEEDEEVLFKEEEKLVSNPVEEAPVAVMEDPIADAPTPIVDVP